MKGPDLTDPAAVRAWFRAQWGEDPPPAPNAKALKYSDDQPRDESGRWTDTGGGGGAGIATAPNAGARGTNYGADSTTVGRGGVPGPEAAFVAATRGLPYEVVAFYDAEGTGLWEASDRIQNHAPVPRAAERDQTIPGAVRMVHNHPGLAVGGARAPSGNDLSVMAALGVPDGVVVGYTDDGDEVDFAVHLPAAEVIIARGGGVARFQAGSIAARNFLDDSPRQRAAMLAKRVWAEHGARLVREHGPAMEADLADATGDDDRKAVRDRWNVRLTHEAMTATAAEIGATYTRTIRVAKGAR